MKLPYLELSLCNDNEWWMFQCRLKVMDDLQLAKSVANWDTRWMQVRVLVFFLLLLQFCHVWLTLPLSTDMPIFGQCPAQDDFYLVMCSHCGQVVKPQAFQAHYGKCDNTRTRNNACPVACIYVCVFSSCMQLISFIEVVLRLSLKAYVTNFNNGYFKQVAVSAFIHSAYSYPWTNHYTLFWLHELLVLTQINVWSLEGQK